MNRPRRILPLHAKLAMGFSLLTVAAIGITAHLYYQSTKAMLRQDIRNRLHDAVAIGALQVDAAAHAKLTAPDQEGSPDYLRLKKTLQRIRDAGTDIRFVYTMRQDAQGNIVFIVDAEESEQDIAHLGDIYDDAGDFLEANFAAFQSATTAENFYTDKWGTWLSGYAPIYAPDGRREAVLGMDISADNVLAQERDAFRRVLVIFFGSIPVSGFIGWLFGLALTAPISKLIKGAEQLSNGNFNYRIKIRSNDETAILAATFNQAAERLGGLVARLEERVEERTAQLSRRTSQLQAATRVARQATAIRELPQLLDDTVRTISDQFGFYHTGIFLTEAEGGFVSLQAASSEGGQKMLTRGHRLQIGEQGIVGYAAAQKRPRVALDVGEDAYFFNNPDLPETRSEAALPLVVRNRVIGVLDIQSKQARAFSPEDIETFQTLADQIALIIENARLFEEMNLAVSQLERLATDRIQQAWMDGGRAGSHAYQYTPAGIQPAFRAGDRDDQLIVPILLHNQKIGEIAAKRSEGDWEAREQAMLAEIAAQVALALENARLLDEARQRAIHERTVGEVVSHIGAAHDMDAVLRVAAQEIGKALGDSEVVVQIRAEELEAK